MTFSLSVRAGHFGIFVSICSSIALARRCVISVTNRLLMALSGSIASA
jgi:hypothetical protein